MKLFRCNFLKCDQIVKTNGGNAKILHFSLAQFPNLESRKNISLPHSDVMRTDYSCKCSSVLKSWDGSQHMNFKNSPRIRNLFSSCLHGKLISH